MNSGSKTRKTWDVAGSSAKIQGKRRVQLERSQLHSWIPVCDSPISKILSFRFLFTLRYLFRL